VSPIPTDWTAETEDSAELVAAAKAGDRIAFEELVRATYVDTYTLALRLTANEEDARDVVQEVYLRAWKGIGRFRGDAQFGTWLYRITANVASTHITRRRRNRSVPLEAGHEPAEERISLQPEAANESAATLERLAAAVAELPPKLRAIVVLKDVYGLSHDAIAQELGISVSAAKVRLHRGRRKLRETWLDEDARVGRAV
jgi:RNA polymerase sigma-70 factor (ECF subfamily)